jgi:2,3-bisphosphoglycerate-dependent phosphoglycerate mutase
MLPTRLGTRTQARPDNQAMTDFILIRHGETNWNRELRFQGQLDVPLNAVGQEQARRVGERLSNEFADHLIASDLLRTQQTAAPISLLRPTQTALAAQLNAGLREQSFGKLEGMSVPEIQQTLPEVWTRWTQFDADYTVDGGETARQFHARVMRAMAALAQTHPDKTLVVVTHGGVLDMIYRTAQEQVLSGPRVAEIPNGGINRVRSFDRAGGLKFEIIDWADTRHLADMAAQPVYDQVKLATDIGSPSEA